jgi:hypothetical protein
MMMKGWRDVVLKLREARRPRRSVIGLRADFDAETIRSIAEELKDRPRERLLAVAAIFDGATRVEAARNADVTAQTLRDWVRRFNENGPDGRYFCRVFASKAPLVEIGRFCESRTN